jgi:hypothetical protein
MRQGAQALMPRSDLIFEQVMPSISCQPPKLLSRSLAVGMSLRVVQRLQVLAAARWHHASVQAGTSIENAL